MLPEQVGDDREIDLVRLDAFEQADRLLADHVSSIAG
jgi:hypothetical protein